MAETERDGETLVQVWSTRPADDSGAKARLARLAKRLREARPTSRADFSLGRTTPHPAALFGAHLAAIENVQHASKRTAGAWLDEERAALGRLGKWLGMTGTGIPTSGGSEAILLALLTAVHRRCPEVATAGTWGLHVRIYVSHEGHGAVAKAARLLGLGDDSVVRIRTLGPSDHRMDRNNLADRVGKDRAAGRMPLAIVATLGTTSVGAVDDLDALAPFARAHNLWLHGDAAWGGVLPFGPDGATWRARFAQCDSLSADPHKTFHCPLGLGALYIQTEGAAPLDVVAHYVPKEADAPWSQGITWSRGAIALPLVALLEALGEDGFHAEIAGAFERAGRFRALVASAGPLAVPCPLPVATYTHFPKGKVLGIVEELRRHGFATSPVRFTNGELGLRFGFFDGAVGEDDLRDAATAFLRISGSIS